MTVPSPDDCDDPYGYGVILNADRTSRGLRRLAHDASLAEDAARNGARGFGHFTRGYGIGQCVGVGSIEDVEVMWLADPPHAAILLDHSATLYGIACVGNVWTVNIS